MSKLKRDAPRFDKTCGDVEVEVACGEVEFEAIWVEDNSCHLERFISLKSSLISWKTLALKSASKRPNSC